MTIVIIFCQKNQLNTNKNKIQIINKITIKMIIIKNIIHLINMIFIKMIMNQIIKKLSLNQKNQIKIKNHINYRQILTKHIQILVPLSFLTNPIHLQYYHNNISQIDLNQVDLFQMAIKLNIQIKFMERVYYNYQELYRIIKMENKYSEIRIVLQKQKMRKKMKNKKVK